MRNLQYLILVILPLFIGCSGGSSITPSEDAQIYDFSVFTSELEGTNHNLIGIWSFKFNEKDNTFSIEPDRCSATHYNATRMIPPPEITVLEFNPFTRILNVNVTLTNPYDFDAFDVRLIIYTTNTGTQLINTDNWTGLFDIPGGSIINPFKAFAKDSPDRSFGANTQYSENLTIKLPLHSTSVSFAVDASFPGNCEEPYQITNFVQDLLNDDTGSSCTAQVTVKDWHNDVYKVYLHCPAITGETLSGFEQISDENWRLIMTNRTGAVSQNYPGYIIASSNATNPVYLYEPVIINVTRLENHWVRTFAGTLGNDTGHAVACDSDDNIYISGNYFGTQDFDPGPFEDIHPGYIHGGTFLTRYNPQMIYQWTKTWAGTSDYPNVDLLIQDGSIYVAGQFVDTVDFDPGPGSDLHTSNGFNDNFLSKFDLDGNFIWVLTWGSVESEYRRLSISVDSNENLYLTGSFKAPVDFDPGSGISEFIPNGGFDLYLSKFDTDGVYSWTKTWGGTGDDLAYDLSNDASGNLYLTGGFENRVDFKPGDGSATKISNGEDDAFVLKVDQNGEYLKVIALGGDGSDSGTCVTSSNTEDIFVGGYFENAVDFNPDPILIDERISSGSTDRFLSKFDNSLNYQWCNANGDLKDDIVNGISFDKVSDTVYVTGNSQGTNEWVRFFVEKYTSDGSLSWGHFWPVIVPEGYRGYQFGQGITVDSSGNSYTVGEFHSLNLDFDPGPGVDKRSSSGSDFVIYLLKLGPTGYWE